MSGVLWTGIDYAGAQAGLMLAGIEISPEIWRDLRLIEEGALAALNEAGK